MQRADTLQCWALIDGFYPSYGDGTETSLQEKGGRQWFDTLQR